MGNFQFLSKHAGQRALALWVKIYFQFSIVEILHNMFEIKASLS